MDFIYIQFLRVSHLRSLSDEYEHSYAGPQNRNGDFLENGSDDFDFESFKELHLHFPRPYAAMLILMGKSAYQGKNLPSPCPRSVLRSAIPHRLSILSLF
jgi:hypothetical protein